MLKVEIDYDQLQSIITTAVDKAIEQYAFKNDLPPILSKQQFMALLDISSTKATELLNRQDFPVLRELGHPRVVTRLFIQWCETHTDWIQDNAGDGWKKRRGRSA